MIRPFVRYFDVSGRSSPSEYWLFVLFQALVGLGIFTLWVALVLVAPPGSMMIPSIGLGLCYAVFWLGCVVPNLTATIRRLHDTNRSTVWLLLHLPIVLAIVQTVAIALREVRGSPREVSQLLSDSALGSVLGISSLICEVALIAFMILPGTRGENRFGAPAQSLTTETETPAKPDAPVKAEPPVPVSVVPEARLNRVTLASLPAKPALQSARPPAPRPVAPPDRMIPVTYASEPAIPYLPLTRPVQPFGRRKGQ